MLKGETVKGEKTRKRKKDRLRHWNISRSSSHNNNNKSVQRALCLCLCCHCHHCCGYCFCLLTIAAAAAATNDASPAVINEWAMKTCERATSLHYHIKCECDLPETADKDWLSSFSFSSTFCPVIDCPLSLPLLLPPPPLLSFIQVWVDCAH